MGTTKARLTGERPHLGVTPSSLLGLHHAGYRAVAERLGPGKVLDIGCGRGFGTVRLCAEGRRVLGVDRSTEAGMDAPGRRRGTGAPGAEPAATSRGAMSVARMDALALALGPATVDWACSSHVIEHFVEPEAHVREVARVLAPGGTAFFLTPNRPADFENPFHVHLFERPELVTALGPCFAEVWVGGIDASAPVKADFAARRAKAARLLALDVLDLRHRLPRDWYVAAYTRLLPLAYRWLARSGSGSGSEGFGDDDWFVTAEVDDTTPVLFAVCRRPTAT